MTQPTSDKSASYRRVAEQIGVAKKELIRALGISEDASLVGTHALAKLIASAEVLQNKFYAKAVQP